MQIGNMDEAIEIDMDESLMKSKIKCRFGLIADIQHCDIDNGKNFRGDKIRYYRNSIEQLKFAIAEWKKCAVDFVIDLGDTIDGLSKRHGQSETNLQRVLETYSQLHDIPVYFHWGNHEFYNFKRKDLMKMETFCCSKLHSVTSLMDEDSEEEKLSNYYHFSPCPTLRLVFIDPFEFSVLGYDLNHPIYKEAHSLLKEKNPNQDHNNTKDMPEKDKKFVRFNGRLKSSLKT